MSDLNKHIGDTKRETISDTENYEGTTRRRNHKNGNPLNSSLCSWREKDSQVREDPQTIQERLNMNLLKIENEGISGRELEK